MGKQRGVLFGLVTVAVLVAGAIPVQADTAGRPDDPEPDELYEDVEGPEFDEDKSEGEGMAGMAAAVEEFAMAGGESFTSVSFPFVMYNWTILSWYSTNDGIRFFGVSYKGEQILYEYRTPWVYIGGSTRALSPGNLIEGPNLMIYYASSSFQVKARYNLGNPNVDVTVSQRFYNDGTFEPWVLVNGFGVPYTFGVGQKFDFDLGGSGDDTQQYYDGTQWKLPASETSTLDATYGEDGNGYQWRDMDTDASGSTYTVAQIVYVKPYHTDAPRWWNLRYGAGQTNGQPSVYCNGQSINLYIPGAPDPYTGYDAVNWYVSSYTNVNLAYPGPWLKVIV